MGYFALKHSSYEDMNITTAKKLKIQLKRNSLGELGGFVTYGCIVLNSTVPVRSAVMLQCSGPDTGPEESGLAAQRSIKPQWSDQRPGTLKVQLRKPTVLYFLTVVLFLHITHFVAI